MIVRDNSEECLSKLLGILKGNRNVGCFLNFLDTLGRIVLKEIVHKDVHMFATFHSELVYVFDAVKYPLFLLLYKRRDYLGFHFLDVRGNLLHHLPSLLKSC